ncbi:MAG: glycosyltransferase involved in cell wall biosynthesis [Saprospiraceae bacterium]|jgi:glycosyltransferase involved in cell wall biosynthesis
MRKLKEDFKPDLDISVVLPVYNEEDNIVEMHAEIDAAMKSMGKSYEIIFVDDGSKDETLARLVSVQEQDPNTVVVEFRRNFGQTAAMAAGFDFARGEIIITMDADRQNDPLDIPKLVDKINEGYDLVSGWRHQRQDGLWLRLIPSKIANKLISKTTDVKLNDYGCSLKAFRWEVAKQLSMYGEMHRFIPAIASWIGVKIAEVKVNHRARVAGVSKYGISRTFRVILDLMTVKFLMHYSQRPLQFFGAIGMVSTSIGLLIGLTLSFQKIFMGLSIGDRPILLLAVLLVFIGLQFITAGLVAEMITRTYHESQDKPIYNVRNIFRRKQS